ncbi:transcription initiation factor TFIID subunit 13 [Aspergillus brasiliensis]|uniref:Transcription initiation factor TFIID subunit 13 n=1 Tax=Aspergillus brasiliensis TaxID=319629 RepID=A0A9W6DLA2_9EURO|nr:transcription initiation factor TFIID subunit 13 [Aspergillus brasiliensis]GKZ42473.1 transcription initiation factor TFIID subunit 13 [Aspergillus brasiliensis]
MSSVTSPHRLSARKSGHRSAAAPASIRNTPSARPASQPLRRSLPSKQTSRASPAPPRQISTGHVSSQLASAWPFNPEETELIRAGYCPAFKPNPVAEAEEQSSDNNKKRKKKKGTKDKTDMAEPRARAARHKGQMNFATELRLLLLAYGDPKPHPTYPADPLPETIRVLDEIVTDFVLEMCHGAAQYASYSRRQKIKVDDFRFALRRDPNKLGRVQELLRMERELKEARKAFDQNDDQVGNLKDAGKKGLEELGESVDGKKSKGKGKRNARRDSDATEDTAPKKRKVVG